MFGFKRTFLAAALVIAVILAAAGAMANPQVPFDQFLTDLRDEAVARGLPQTLVNQALSGFSPDQEVVKLDVSQPEFKQPFREYLNKRITASRVKQGQEMYAKHSAELNRIAKQYGVAPQYIVALWGMETNYGGYTGNKNIIKALATLAWNGRGGTRPDRAALFREELMAALKIVEEGHITLESMKGSWAGAFGQVQFMPSSFQRMAVDGNGDGHKDIWNNMSDTFASAANYLARSGWINGQRWGREVALPAGFDRKLVGLDHQKSLEEWKTLGVMTAGKQPLPVEPGIKASLLSPDAPDGATYLVYNNFHVIREWNKSNAFALTTGILADRIAAAPKEPS